jgi:NAD-dependent SIR2 family protein deacetylase
MRYYEPMGEITFKGFRCERCGHIWAPRQALDSAEPTARPRVCPKCKSAWWDVPRKEKAHRNETKKKGLQRSGGTDAG